MRGIFNKLLLSGTGALLFSFGVATLIFPSIFTKLYGVELPTSDAVAAIRAIVGGGEIALGLIFLLRARLGFTDKSLLILGGAIFSAIVCARIFHLFTDTAVSARFYRELIAESIIGIIFLVRLKTGFPEGVISDSR